jgi:hypothetical protein
MIVGTDEGTIMKKADEVVFDVLDTNRKEKDRKDERNKKDRRLVLGTRDTLRDVRSQWIEAENYQYGKSRQRID